jgi:hypothetical protein
VSFICSSARFAVEICAANGDFLKNSAGFSQPTSCTGEGKYPEQGLGPARVEQSALEQVHLEQVHAGKVATLGGSGGFARNTLGCPSRVAVWSASEKLCGGAVSSHRGVERYHGGSCGRFRLLKRLSIDAQCGRSSPIFWAMRS